MIFCFLQAKQRNAFPCNIQRIQYDELHKVRHFGDFPLEPVIYSGDPVRQYNMSVLGAFENLYDFYGDTVVQLSSSNTYSHGKYIMELRQYLQYLSNNNSIHHGANENLYLFGNNYNGVFQMMIQEYIIPPCEFCEQAGAVTVGIGGIKSGVSFHFHGPGFSESIIGSKRWFLYPPSVTKLVEKFGANTTVAEWVEVFYPLLMDNTSNVGDDGSTTSIILPTGFSTKEWEELNFNLHECVIQPGEVLYFPSQWMHATLNLEQYNLFVSLFLDPQLIR